MKAGIEMGISYLNGEVLHGTWASFVVLLTETANFYINTHTKSTVFYGPGEQLLQRLYNLFEELDILEKPSCFSFKN